MSDLPELAHVGRDEESRPASRLPDPIQLQPTMSYPEARAVPGAMYDPISKSMVLPIPTARSAIAALSMKPALALEYPILAELRDTQIQNVRPTDYATGLGLHINAPVVHQSLVDQGFDWLEFEDGANQDTDLGYAAAMLNKIHFFYLGWARGYGKTLGTAAIIEANGYDRVLVVAPNSSKVDTWAAELALRLPSHAVLIMPNDKVKRIELLNFLRDLLPGGHPFVLVTHFESARIVAEWRGPLARSDKPDTSGYGGWRKLGIEWDLVACDEGHRLAHSGTKLHRGMRNIPTKNRIVLSGSVYQNNWEELFGPLHWGLPNNYAAQWDDWNLRHFDYVEGYGKIFAGILEGHDQLMRDELGVFMVVREKPDKSIHTTVTVDLSPAQRTAYDSLVSEYLAVLEDGTALVASAGVVMLTRLRQIATGLELVSDIVDSSKLDAVVRDVQKYGTERGDDFFVACWYKRSAYSLRDRLAAVGIAAEVVTGDVPQKQRTEIIQRTRHAAQLRGGEGVLAPVVLIGTIETLGESVNLQYLNHVMRVDRSFNPAKNRQVIDRVDRTGQWRDVYATDYVAGDTADELVVMPNLANKDALRAILLGRTA